MNGSAKRTGLMSMAIVAILAGVVFVAGCGSSDSSSGDPAGAEAAAAGGPGGGMFASLTDDQKQCIEDEGVTLPEAPSGATGATGATGSTGSNGGPPQGAPEGMQDLQAAMEKCGVEMPQPPDGAPSDAAPVETSAS